MIISGCRFSIFFSSLFFSLLFSFLLLLWGEKRQPNIHLHSQASIRGKLNVSYVHKNDTKFNKKNKGGKHGFFLCLPLSHEYCYVSKVIYSFNCPHIFTSLSTSTVSLCQTVMVDKYQTTKIF